jgi:hypothetical protein
VGAGDERKEKEDTTQEGGKKEEKQFASLSLLTKSLNEQEADACEINYVNINLDYDWKALMAGFQIGHSAARGNQPSITCYFHCSRWPPMDDPTIFKSRITEC